MDLLPHKCSQCFSLYAAQSASYSEARGLDAAAIKERLQTVLCDGRIAQQEERGCRERRRVADARSRAQRWR